MILNITLRQAERLALMKAPITINDGKASISLFDIPMAALAMLRHWCIVDVLRDQWNDSRLIDRDTEKRRTILKNLGLLWKDIEVSKFQETYYIIRYQTRLHLGNRWFTRTP